MRQSDSRWLEKQVAVTRVACFSRGVGQAACFAAMYLMFSVETFPEKRIWLLSGLALSVLIVVFPTYRLRFANRSVSRDRMTVTGAGMLMFTTACVWMYATLGPYARATVEEVLPHAIIIGGISSSVVLTSMYSRNFAIAILAALLLPFAVTSFYLPYTFGTLIGVLTIVFFGILTAQTSVVDALSKKDVELTEMNEKLLEENKRNTAGIIQAAKMASLGEMSGGIAHEINNPLAVLDGIAYKIDRTIRDENIRSTDLRSSVETLNEQIQRMADIVRGLHRLSRDDSEDEFVQTSIGRIVADTLRISQPMLRRADIRITVNFRDHNAIVLCRPGQISQVILNLVGNAVDALEDQTERWLRIETYVHLDEVVIAVADSGPGIAPEDRARVMEPFFTTKPVGRGTGLGLSISSQIMQSHQGTLVFNPTLPHTTFE
ncbi:MAG: ATP-binding protein, partial [Pseudomonadota bacterium]